MRVRFINGKCLRGCIVRVQSVFPTGWTTAVGTPARARTPYHDIASISCTKCRTAGVFMASLSLWSGRGRHNAPNATRRYKIRRFFEKTFQIREKSCLFYIQKHDLSMCRAVFSLFCIVIQLII